MNLNKKYLLEDEDEACWACSFCNSISEICCSADTRQP